MRYRFFSQTRDNQRLENRANSDAMLQCTYSLGFEA